MDLIPCKYQRTVMVSTTWCISNIECPDPILEAPAGTGPRLPGAPPSPRRGLGNRRMLRESCGCSEQRVELWSPVTWFVESSFRGKGILLLEVKEWAGESRPLGEHKSEREAMNIERERERESVLLGWVTVCEAPKPSAVQPDCTWLENVIKTGGSTGIKEYNTYTRIVIKTYAARGYNSDFSSAGYRERGAEQCAPTQQLWHGSFEVQ